MSPDRKPNKQEREEAERRSAKKNNDFVQMHRPNMVAIRELIKTKPVAADIFLFLSEHMNRQNAVVCSSKVLEEITGKSRSTVSRALAHLEEKKFFSIGKSGTTNIYTMNPNVVWSAARDSKTYCKFEGPILLSVSENKHLVDQVKAMSEKHLDIPEQE